jgi:hypothetical protein
MKYEQACEQVGYDRFASCPIEQKVVCFAYKDGKAKQFDTIVAARAFSKNTETVVANKAEIEQWKSTQAQLRAKAFDVWYTALQAEYICPLLNKELFDLCYAKAYEAGHSAGYDEIDNYMGDFVDFALNARAIVV